MDNINSFLTEWTIDYIKNKDVLVKKIVAIEKNKEGFDIVVRYNDKTSFFVIKPLVNDIEEITGKMDKEGHYSIVMLNNKENLDVVVNNWKKLIDFRNLCLNFVNPFSELDKRWLIFPCVHNNICDDDSLEKGLRAMFEMVEPITEEEMKKKLKQKGN